MWEQALQVSSRRQEAEMVVPWQEQALQLCDGNGKQSQWCLHRRGQGKSVCGDRQQKWWCSCRSKRLQVGLRRQKTESAVLLKGRALQVAWRQREPERVAPSQERHCKLNLQ